MLSLRPWLLSTTPGTCSSWNVLLILWFWLWHYDLNLTSIVEKYNILKKNAENKHRLTLVKLHGKRKKKQPLFLICSSGQNLWLFLLCFFNIACEQGYLREQWEIYKIRKFHIQFKFWPALTIWVILVWIAL